ncbi:MAG TPA: radical SAM protein [Burkholderiales bacterium]|nr:radical SAM protein [Burkholderiales bacterium]
MKVGIIAVHMDPTRGARHYRGVLQPQIGPLIAALLPDNAEVEVVNDTWRDPDWSRDYDLLFLSCLHADFDRARQISHYWRRRGTKTVLGGVLASTYPSLCAPWFDAVVIGDPETTVPRIVDDFRLGRLGRVYTAGPYAPDRVPAPRLELTARQQLLPLSLEVTRGCPFSCDFCGLTAFGTRHHVRPVESVMRDLAQGRAALRGFPGWKGRVAGFYDNNLGGNLGYLRALCAALEGRDVLWGAAVTFNVISDADLVRRMADAGCRGVFVGLESFNPRTLADMGKHQNVVSRARAAIENCHRQGIVVMAGLVLSPRLDDLEYLRSIPSHLTACGLEVPTFVCFEAPIPGTPHFMRLAADPQPMFLPDARLCDFTGYTLVTRPALASTDEFIAAYRALHRELFAPLRRLKKLAHDAWRLAASRRLLGVAFDFFEVLDHSPTLPARRTLLAGTDPLPPELGRVPFTDADFRDEVERAALLNPTRVTDAAGRALPEWLGAVPAYRSKGRQAPQACPTTFSEPASPRPLAAPEPAFVS